MKVGLCTEPADRQRFEVAVRACYSYAGLAEPRRIVWVDSPLVLAFAAPVAATILARFRNQAVSGPLRGAVDEAVYGAVSGAVHGAVSGTVSGAVKRAVHGAVDGAVDGAAHGAVSDTVSEAVHGAVDEAVGDTVHGAVDEAVSEAVHGAVGRAVGEAVGGAVDEAVYGAASRPVGRAVGGAVHEVVHEAVGRAVDEAVYGAVDEAVYGAVGRAVGVAVERAVREAVYGAVDEAVYGAVGRAVGVPVERAVRGAVEEAVYGAVSNLWYHYLGGQLWVGGWWYGNAWTSFFREVCQLDLPGDLWDRSLAYDATAESACWWWPHNDFVLVSDRPYCVRLEPNGRGQLQLHCGDGPAVGWQHWGVYAWHGVRVPAHVIMAPETLTAEQITNESNVEVRRVMIERCGQERYMREINAACVHRDDWGELYRTEMVGDEPLVMVKVVNSTPEADGSFKDYWLRVPPTMKTAHQAVAWSFAKEADEYEPSIQT